MMKVRGEAVLSIPIFILKKFGRKEYNRWLDSLSIEARKVYSSPIHKGDWFPLTEIMTEPTTKICELFYKNSKRGAWICGRYSAEYGLKGVYKIFVKLCSPNILIKKASSIISLYYNPSEVEIVENGKNYAVVHIKKFPEIDKVIEYRIAGWMERAAEICGCKNVSVIITKSLTENDPFTEYKVSWKTSR